MEIVRNFLAMLDRGDAEWDLLPPDFVFDFSRLLTGPGVLLRDPARAEYDRARHEIFKEGRVGWEPEQLIDAGDKVLAFTKISGRGKSGDAVISARGWSVWTFRDGKPIEWAYFGSHDREAFEDAGLSK